MIKILLTALIIFSFCYPSFSVELAELESETAEELLLFFEEEELVIATRHKTPVKKAPAIATVITAREIRNMGARNITDVLRKIPGIGIVMPDVAIAHATIEVRGIKADLSEKVLIMIDGHSVNDSHQSSAMLIYDDLSVDNIKKIEVIRGPGSALYGANAFTAVINIVTMEAEDIKGLQITAGRGSFDTRHYNLLFSNEWGKLKAAVHFDYLDTNGQSFFIEQDAIGNSGDTLEWQEKPDIGLNVSYGDFTLRGRYIKNRIASYIGVTNALNDESDTEYWRGYLDLAYDKDITEDIGITSRLYSDYQSSDQYWEIFPEGFQGVHPDGVIGNPSYKERVLGGEVTLDYSISDHLLAAGIVYEEKKQYDVTHIANFNPNNLDPLGSMQDISEQWNFNKDVAKDIWAIYLQDVWNIKDNISLTAGIRHDHYSDFGGTTNPRAGLVWEFMKDTSLKLLYGSAFRAPSFTELYHLNNPVDIGNPDLNPEKIKTYEAGLEHRMHQNYTLRLNFFYNDVEDLIILGEKPSPTEAAVWENRGSAKVKGVEAELLFDFGHDSYGYLNHSYQDPRDGETDKSLPNVPSQRANAGINLAPWKYLNANINVSWTGKRPRAEGDIRDDLSSSTLVDLTLIAKKFYETLEIRGSVYNLFDEDYRDPSPFPVEVPNDYPTNGRMFLIEARYTF
jgi:iron complex outermembrane receptor protein